MAIDEKKLKDDIWKYALTCKNTSFEFARRMSDIEKIIDEQPKLDVPDINVGKWIPCSQELPPKPEDRMFQAYIVQKENVIEPFVADWDGKRWWVEWELESGTVLAWMPLPESYKGEE